MSSETLTLAQFGQRYHLSSSTIYREINAGRLRVTKIRGRTLIADADAKAWFEGHRAVTTTTGGNDNA